MISIGKENYFECFGSYKQRFLFIYPPNYNNLLYIYKYLSKFDNGY